MKLSVYFCFFSVSVQSQWLIKGESPTSLLLLELKSKHSNMSETFFISHCQGMGCSTVIHSMQNFIPLSSHLWEMLINSERFFFSPLSLFRMCARKPSWNVSFHISTLTVKHPKLSACQLLEFASGRYTGNCSTLWFHVASVLPPLFFKHSLLGLGLYFKIF